MSRTAKVARMKTSHGKNILIAMDKVGSWYPIYVNNQQIVNRATKELAQETVDRICKIRPNGYIQIVKGDDERYEVWLATSASINALRDVRVEVYLTRRYAERFARKVASALEVPCVSVLPAWDFEEEKRQKAARRKK